MITLFILRRILMGDGPPEEPTGDMAIPDKSESHGQEVITPVTFSIPGGTDDLLATDIVLNDNVPTRPYQVNGEKMSLKTYGDEFMYWKQRYGGTQGQ
ncbi:MAG: hypothetical protein P1U65_12375 [Minwuia sp.]|nr:hypothetical protein [Minwuia sp.]